MGFLLIGAGGHGRALLELLRDAGLPPPAGVLDDAAGCPGLLCRGMAPVPWLGPVARAAELFSQGSFASAHVALGRNALRRQLGERLLAIGYDLPVLRHPSAVVAGSARIGPGSALLPRAVVGAGAEIGAFAILNTGSIAEHDSVLGPGCHLAPGSVLGGGVTLGAEVLVGILAGVKPGVRIGDGATVGLGAAVLADVAPGQDVGGVPARPL
ncbi:acetyltransferase [Roseomonas sp. 18066]|uniref:acetyltransferase n=1 Tax=Roseomonas sp. 18066 TaxID=2681412 RepID=UPI001F1A3A9B|nr:acetyltransferase [Roseomonas sp. 18066]